MLSWLFAKYYDRLIADAEEKCLHEWRASLLKNVSGRVLEMGCGTGANLPYYNANIEHLALAEPNVHMRQRVLEKLPQYPNLNVKILDYHGETIPSPDQTYDAVVSTLVLCTVEDPQKILEEIYRVLKPQGRFVFLEHVAAENNPSRYKWQKRLEPIWKIIGHGCHLTRSTEQSIVQAGFKIEEITRESMRGVPPFVRPSIRGKATKNLTP